MKYKNEAENGWKLLKGSVCSEKKKNVNSNWMEHWSENGKHESSKKQKIHTQICCF